MADVDEALEPTTRPPDTGGGAPVEEGAPTWIVTFADMMSLLLTFFILMFSMSEVKQERFLLASESLREAMGSTAREPSDNPMGLMPEPVDPDLELTDPGLNDGATTSPVDSDAPGDDVIDVFTEAYMKMIEERLRDLVEASGLDSTSVEIVREENGVYLRIRDAALFATARANLTADGEALVRGLSAITKSLGVPTIVSGHADSRPINTASFPSNWELSAARAAGVARLLVREGQDPETIRVQSFGEYRPVADDSTAEGRARNRRVELFFSRDAIADIAKQLQAEAAGAGAGSTEVDSISGPAG